MSKTKYLREKSIDLMDFSTAAVTAVRASARIRTFHSIIRLGRYACQSTDVPGIRLAAKTVMGVFVSVVKNVRTVTNLVIIRIAINNKAKSLGNFDLKVTK